MAPAREQLLASTFWSVRRPKFPLTAGHYVLRLNDPSIAFSADSAADLLRCHAHLRHAMVELAGATATQLYLALNWQPVGDSVGEPLPETSTPTLHTFFALPGSTTAAAALSLPALQRVAWIPEMQQDAVDSGSLDARLRSWRGGRIRAEPGTQSKEDSGDRAAPAFHLAPAQQADGQPFRVGHWVARPSELLPALDRMGPAATLELATAMESLVTHADPRFQGMTLWATDSWEPRHPGVVHLFGRRHGDESRPLAAFVADGGLDLPSASPTVEK